MSSFEKGSLSSGRRRGIGQEVFTVHRLSPSSSSSSSSSSFSSLSLKVVYDCAGNGFIQMDYRLFWWAFSFWDDWREDEYWPLAPYVRITQQKYITSLNVYFRRFEMVLSIFVIQKVKDVIFVVDILFSKCRKTSLLDFCSYSTLRIMSFFN